MSKFDLALPGALGEWYRQLWLRYYFKFVLPRIETTVIEGVRLDLRPLPLKVRNRILMGYEEAERQMCREILSAEDTVLELGGGIGFLGLFCQMRIGVRHYVTVEANPATIEILKRNYEMNGREATVWNYALGESDGVAELNIGGDFWEHFVVCSTRKNRPNILRVPALTLSSLLRRSPPATNALIIDIEGAERFINPAALPDRINKIVIELHPGILGKRASAEIVAGLTREGFRTVREMENTLALIRK